MTHSSQNPRRDGGKFKPYMNCPNCGEFALHYMRTPNPRPPESIRVPNRDTVQMGDKLMTTHGGRFVEVSFGRIPGRWDERPFEVVRVCVECKHEWGCT